MSDSPDLNPLRHSLAHLLGAALLELYPGTKLTIGPAVDNGFYYDADIPEKISAEEFPKIEAKMRELAKDWSAFSREEVTPEAARERFAGNEYKLELIGEIAAKGEPVTLYTSGSFTDLCRGGHVEDFKDVDLGAFSLARVAGAYWRGDEARPMLTRVYGYAFPSADELVAYKAMLEEAAKRDHRLIGKQQDLFVFSELVGPGLPLWTPKGTVLRHELDAFVWSLRKARGYERVEIPHITKKDLYERSGHWAKFADELFRIKTREGHEFAMKPMNCPHHTQLYARKQWSYRELPQRYANTTMVYRDEQSGELGGLNRVRSITQDDAHVFCRMSQAAAEAGKVWDIIQDFYGAFGLDNFRVRLSTSDPAQPEKYLGSRDSWEMAENALREVAEQRGVAVFDGVGEAAFYGPKLDFMAKDAIGREHQVATIQFDFNMPEGFDLTCVNEDGQDERIVMIHAAIMGSIERFLVVLIEHVAGAFPLWLAPVQAKILPVSDKFADYGSQVLAALKDAGIRAELAAEDSLGKRIRAAELEKVPLTIVVGEKEATAGTVSVRNNRTNEQHDHPLADFVSATTDAIRSRA